MKLTKSFLRLHDCAEKLDGKGYMVVHVLPAIAELMGSLEASARVEESLQLGFMLSGAM